MVAKYWHIWSVKIAQHKTHVSNQIQTHIKEHLHNKMFIKILALKTAV